MSAFLSNMLHGLLPTEVPKGKGRTVSFGGAEPDIRLTTGSMQERVLGYLHLNGVSAVAREIANGINSPQARVTKTLKDLVESGDVEAIKHEGCVMEYFITAQGVKMLKASPVFFSGSLHNR